MKKIIIYIFGLGLMLSLNSCKKFLTQTPTTSPTLPEYFQNYQDCETAIAGAYSLLRAAVAQPGTTFPSPTNGRSMKHYIMQDYRCGSYVTSSTRLQTNAALGGLNSTTIHSSASNYGFGDWTVDFQAIAHCNLIIDRVSKMTDEQLSNAPTNPTAYRNRIVGEAQFIRAYLYFTMVQYWGDVPYTDTYYAEAINAPLLGRTNKDSVCMKVEADCMDALQRLGWPEIYSTSQKAVRATKGSVFALLANMYLWQGTVHARQKTPASDDLNLITKAGAALDSILLTNKYTLTDTANYASAYAGKANESIFEINMLSSDNEGSRAHMAVSFLTGTSFIPSITSPPIFYYTPTAITNMFGTETQDVRYRKGFRSTTAVYGGTSTAIFMPLKYTNVVLPVPTNNQIVTMNNNMVIYRLASMQLLRAEVYLYQGNYTKALDIINANRLRNGVTTRLTLPTTNVLNNMTDYYMKERFKEMFFEGSLFNDMLRTRAFANTVSGATVYSWMTTSLFNQQAYYVMVSPNLLQTNPYLAQNNYYLGKL